MSEQARDVARPGEPPNQQARDRGSSGQPAGRPLVLDRATTSAIAALCREYGVARLDLFGSATTDRFDPERSDVDFLLKFHPDIPDAFTAYFDLKEALEALLDRPVDLVSLRALRNPYFAESVGRGRRELYAA